jgi:hypothetical protein
LACTSHQLPLPDGYIENVNQMQNYLVLLSSKPALSRSISGGAPPARKEMDEEKKIKRTKIRSIFIPA